MDSPKAPAAGGDENVVDQNPAQEPLRRHGGATEERPRIFPAVIADDRIMQLPRARRVVPARRFFVAVRAFRPVQLAGASAGLSQVASTTAAIAVGAAVNHLSQGPASGCLSSAYLFMLLVVLMAAVYLLIKATAEEDANWMVGAAVVLLAVALVLVLGQVLLLEP